MARGGRKGGSQRPVPGFRPGKEPPQLRKQRAVQQLGGDVSGAQERLMEVFAGRTPEEARALIRRWWIGMLVATVVLFALGAVLYLWSIVAGVVVHVLALGALYLFWQVHRKRGDLEAVADLVSGGAKSTGKRPKGAKGGGRRRRG